MSKVPGARTVSVKETRELSSLPWVRDEEISSPGAEARILPDGRVLVYWGEGQKGNLYPSREPLVKMHREAAEELAKLRAGIGPAQTLLPPIDDFLRDVEAHAKSLGPRLRIPDDALDGTAASLDTVDKALKRIPWAKRQVPDLVTPLVAYVGEVLRKASGGHWSKSAAPRTPAEPMVRADRERVFQPFAIVFLPMVEPSRRIPLRSAVDTALRVG
jgi:hypothetical protein